MSKQVRLLNGEFVDYAETIKQMDDDGFYYGFLGKHTLSSSTVKDILDGRYFDKTVELTAKTKEAFKAGRLIHLAVLEPHRLKDLDVAECKTRNHSLYKSLVEEKGSPEHVYTRRMVDKAEALATKVIADNEPVFSHPNTFFELPEIGDVDGFPFRGKADMIIKDFNSEGRNIIIDLKTTSRLAHWRDSAIMFSYDIQLYIYCGLFNVAPEDFYWLAAEKSTGDTKLFKGTMSMYSSGEYKTKKAIKLYMDGILK